MFIRTPEPHSIQNLLEVLPPSLSLPPPRGLVFGPCSSLDSSSSGHLNLRLDLSGPVLERVRRVRLQGFDSLKLLLEGELRRDTEVLVEEVGRKLNLRVNLKCSEDLGNNQRKSHK